MTDRVADEETEGIVEVEDEDKSEEISVNEDQLNEVHPSERPVVLNIDSLDRYQSNTSKKVEIENSIPRIDSFNEHIEISSNSTHKSEISTNDVKNNLTELNQSEEIKVKYIDNVEVDNAKIQPRSETLAVEMLSKETAYPVEDMVIKKIMLTCNVCEIYFLKNVDSTTVNRKCILVKFKTLIRIT